MSDNLHIRKAKKDIPAILKLYGQPEIDNGVSLSLDEAAEIFNRIQRYPDYALYIAELDDRIAGSFGLLIMDNLGHLGTPSVIVEDVVVAPDLQNRGVGKEMMRYAFVLAARSDCYKITLSANCKRKKAHTFYESLGFEKHGYSYTILIR